MKLNKWLYGVAALAMLAACSDKDVAPDTGGTTTDEGSGYIGIRIQMPTIPSTRANDSFNDGEPSEYALNTSTLVLFRCDDGTSAGNDISQNAKCIGAYELKKSKEHADENPNGQITTQVIRFANVTGMSKNADLKLYALVMANGLDYNLNPSSLETALKGKTIKEVQETITTEMLYTQAKHGKGYASRIFMSNSPLSKYQGGAKDPNTQLESGSTMPVLPVLVEIDKTTYPTEEEAISHPAGIIHIERAVGKITCSSFTKTTGVTVKVDGKNYSLEVDDVYWDLGQDMEKTYLVRNTNRTAVAESTNNPGSVNPESSDPDGNMWTWNIAADNISNTLVAPAGKFRMIGHTQIVAGSDTYYRPYFCQVPGYGKGQGDEKDNYEDKTFRNVKPAVEAGGSTCYMEPEDAVEWDAESAFYPHENTFPVKYMKYANTTRVGFWVTFKFKEVDASGKPVKVDGKDVYLDMDKKPFYTRGLDRSTLYIDNPLEGMAGEYLKGKSKIEEAVKAQIIKTEGVAGEYDNLDLDDLIEFTWGESIEGDGQVVLTSISWKDIDKIDEMYPNLFNDVPAYAFTEQDIAAIDALESVYKYKGGKAFYEVRIKHFGDDLTPWNPDDHSTASTIEESYGPTLAERKRNYLGRYGIVRNNWYDLNVSTIKRLGPPVDPAKWDDSWPGKPDDNKDEYIAVILRVLSWAKRTQNVEF
ncbi:MAG: Mfa1 fimbrilin C-terminal domain-containing protein [Muribaculaceae bacterium]|nr:Mfa1 fimbrilin C-terminal domain-containing protein [Muribaculaceae bacterium]